jgi:O-antigen/teichoic acid export membrane protein
LGEANIPFWEVMMTSRRRTTQWNLFFHYLSIALMMISGVLLVPLYLRNISLELYGAWLATGNILLWLTSIDPGLSSILQQRVAISHGKSDNASISEFIFSGMFISMIITIALLIVGYLLKDYIPIWLNVEKSADKEILVKAFWMAIIGSSLQLYSYTITAINQGLQSSLGIGVIYSVVHVLDILLILILLFMGCGLMSLAYSALWRGGAMFLGNVMYLNWRMGKEKMEWRFSLNKIRELIGLMPFTFISQSSGVVANNLDAFIVARFLGAELVPILVLTKKGFDICRIIISRPVMAITPALSHLIGEGGFERARDVLIRLICMMVWGVFLVGGGLFSLNEAFVRYWVGSNLYAGNEINILLCLSLILTVISSSLSNICMALGAIKSVSVAILVQSLIFIAILTIGVIYFGLIGLVIASILSVAIVGGWYFPLLLKKLINLSQKDCRLIFFEFASSFMAALIVSVGFSFFKTTSINIFAIQIFIYIFMYGLVLIIISKRFRKECVGIYFRLRSN